MVADSGHLELHLELEVHSVVRWYLPKQSIVKDLPMAHDPTIRRYWRLNLE
jgi:hypothetical protein